MRQLDIFPKLIKKVHPTEGLLYQKKMKFHIIILKALKSTVVSGIIFYIINI